MTLSIDGRFRAAQVASRELATASTGRKDAGLEAIANVGQCSRCDHRHGVVEKSISGHRVQRDVDNFPDELSGGGGVFILGHIRSSINE